MIAVHFVRNGWSMGLRNETVFVPIGNGLELTDDIYLPPTSRSHAEDCRGSARDCSPKRAELPTMNPAAYFDLYMVRRSIVFPLVVCVFSFVRLWWKGELHGVQYRVFVLWFVTAEALQVASRNHWVAGGNNWLWIAGYLALVALAIVLLFKVIWTDSV
jgi:hypothetical protein